MQARTFGPHNAFSVGEVFDEKDEELPDFIGDGGYFSSMFDFSTTIFGGSRTAGMTVKPSLRTIIRNAVSTPSSVSGILVIFPIL